MTAVSAYSGLSGISCVGGHDGDEGDLSWPDARNPAFPTPCLTSSWAGADPKTAFDPNGLLDDLKKALAKRALNAEMDHHLATGEAPNSRNGYGKKTVVTDTGKIELEVPRDRQASFDPQLIAKYQRRFPGFDEKIISMYARGMTTGRSPATCATSTASMPRPT